MFRFIDTDRNNGAMNMAIDEALLIAQSEERLPPAIRVYQFVPPTLSIGYFQSMEEEVDIEHCAEKGFDYVRRSTGGRAVLHDRELTYSVTISYPHKILEMNLLDSFHYISGGIIKAIEKTGGRAHFSKREDNEIVSPSCFASPTFSDIIINGKKVVGSAQMRNKYGLLQHGAILLRVSIEDIFYCLKIKEALKLNLIDQARSKISSLSDELGREITFYDVKSALRYGLSEILGEELVDAELTPSERKIAEELYLNKYNTSDWNFKR